MKMAAVIVNKLFFNLARSFNLLKNFLQSYLFHPILRTDQMVILRFAILCCVVLFIRILFFLFVLFKGALSFFGIQNERMD